MMGMLEDSIVMKYIQLILQYPATLLFTILVITFFYYYFCQLNFFKINGIPHETPTAIFGNMMQPCFGTVSFVERLKIHYSMDTISQYMGFYDFNNPVILVRSPEIVSQILEKYATAFSHHYNNYSYIHDVLFRNHTFSLHGERKYQLDNYFHKLFEKDNMEAMFPSILKRCKNLIKSLDNHTENGYKTINSKDIFGRYINDVISTCAFGTDDSDSINNPNDEFYKMAIDALTFKGLKLYKLFLMRTYPDIFNYFRMNLSNDKVRNYFITIVRDVVATREINMEKRRRDMIEIMMEVRFKNGLSETLPDITIEDITAQAFGFYMTGYDSTSTLLCFVTHMLSINPIIQTKLYEEVIEVYRKYHDQPTYEVINNMIYLDAVICETLRIYPITPYIERVCTRHVDLLPSVQGGKMVKIIPGTNVWIPHYALQTDTRHYPYPRIFRPERFIKTRKQILDSNAYFPFGMGIRKCCGDQFALFVTKLCLYHLIAEYNLNTSDRMILPLELDPWIFQMFPKGGFWLDLEQRKDKPTA